MVDPNRVRHMARMAILEENDTDDELNISRYRWNDYLLMRILFTLVSGSLSFAALAVLAVMIGWDAVNRFVAGHSLQVCMVILLAVYAGFMAISMIVTVILAWRRYQKAGLLRQEYRRELEQLEE